jgi:hypothetical protein
MGDGGGLLYDHSIVFQRPCHAIIIANLWTIMAQNAAFLRECWVLPDSNILLPPGWVVRRSMHIEWSFKGC